MKNLSYEQKTFYLFLLVQIILYTGVSLIRLIMPTDALEGIYWGSLHDFGTNKHPPLAAWITYVVFYIFKKDFFIYLTSQIFIAIGFIFVYKTARLFLNEVQSILSVVLLAGCWVYGYITSYYGFNPDVVLLCFLPIITYFGYKSVKNNKLSDWIILGIMTGLSFLNKYQTALLILPIIIWAIIFNRKIFKSWKVYFSIIIAFLIFLPHLLWLIKYDFFSFSYFGIELKNRSFLNRIGSSLIFLIVQLSVVSGSILMFYLLKLKQKTKFIINQTLNNQDACFLLLVALLPNLIQTIMIIVAGGTARPRWGFEFLFLTGVILFYFFPVKEILKNEFNFVVKFAYIIMIIIALIMGSLFAFEKNYRSRYPVEKVTNDIVGDWNEHYDVPVKYIGGFLEWTLPIVVYNMDKNYECILYTYNHESPWITKDDLKKHGAIIIFRDPQDVVAYVNFLNVHPNNTKNIVPTNYKFELKNAFGLKREYSIYYYMIPPEKYVN
ncbi:glycosyltransferase family 39 protein [bacterium]|nr:glycosyltransferase family 39 protein [bacterium]